MPRPPQPIQPILSLSLFGAPRETDGNASEAIVPPATGTPGGSVRFFAGTTLLGVVPLVNGIATLTTPAPQLGTNLLTAAYIGDATRLGSRSPRIAIREFISVLDRAQDYPDFDPVREYSYALESLSPEETEAHTGVPVAVSDDELF